MIQYKNELYLSSNCDVVRSSDKDTLICKLLDSGDQKGMVLLFDCYYSQLVAWSNTYLRDLNMAEDVVQDLFIEIWEKRLYKKFKPDVLSSFLRVLVRNKSVNRVVKRDPLFRFSGLNNVEVAWEEYVNESESVLQKLFDEISLLPPRSKDVLECVFIKGMKYREAAEHLGVSISTVKTLLLSSVSKLRGKFSNSNIYHLIVLFFKREKNLVRE